MLRKLGDRTNLALNLAVLGDGSEDQNFFFHTNKCYFNVRCIEILKIVITL